MPDDKMYVPVQTKPSWWARNRNYLFLWVLGFATVRWAIEQLRWLFGWSAEPVGGHLSRVFDASVILVAGSVLMVQAFQHIRRRDEARRAALDRFHDRAVKAKERHA